MPPDGQRATRASPPLRSSSGGGKPERLPGCRIARRTGHFAGAVLRSVRTTAKPGTLLPRTVPLLGAQFLNSADGGVMSGSLAGLRSAHPPLFSSPSRTNLERHCCCAHAGGEHLPDFRGIGRDQFQPREMTEGGCRYAGDRGGSRPTSPEMKPALESALFAGVLPARLASQPANRGVFTPAEPGKRHERCSPTLDTRLIRFTIRPGMERE